MAATQRTMAEVLASSPPMPSSSTIKNSDSGDYANAVAGTAVVAENNNNNNNNNIKEEHDSSSNIMIKTFPYLTITVYIPTACVGVLIGKRGSNIDSIQKLAAKESTKSQISPRGGARSNNKSSKQQSKTNNNNSNGGNGGNNPKAVSPESVRISVVNYPPPPPNAQHPQGFDQHYKNSIHHNTNLGGESATGAGVSPTQPQASAAPPMMDNMGVPPTYTELDFSDPQWTPIVIRADPIAAIYAANAIHDICCPEYVVDRNQLVYIMDVPVPAVASGNAHNGNLRHASIVGKRGNKLIQLSADHKCRIMVPPKQLGHNVIQLEAPLKECCSCLKAILGKLQAGSGSNDDREGQTEATKSSPNAMSPSKNSKNNSNSSKGNNNNNGNKKNDNVKNNFQMTLIIQPLPSQTKLRNIARKTETKILKKRIPKSQQQRNQKQPPPPQKQEQDPESKPSEPSADEAEAGDPPQEKQEQGATSNNSNNSNNNGNSDNKVSWRLTVVATSEKKVMKAVDMLKVLNSKGYEVIVEEWSPNNCADTSSKSFVEGGLDDDTDAGAGADSSLNGGTVDGSKSGPTTNGNNGRGGGRGGRNKKQRHRNNYRGNNGKDNGSKPQQPPMTTPVAAVGDS